VRHPLILLLLALIAGASAGSLVTRWYQARHPSVAPPTLVRDLVASPAMPEAVVEQHRKDNFSALGGVPEIMQLPGAFTRSEALHVLAGRADGAAVQGHIFAAARIADDVEREQALGILFARLAEIDPASALALARTAHFAGMRSIESTVWSTWARKDFDAAVFAAKTQTTSLSQNFAAQALYAAFGFMGNDITDRIEAELGIGPDRAQRARYLYRLADGSPVEAIDYINAMAPGTEKSWNVNWLAYYLALGDPEGAQAFATRFETSAERQQFSDVLAAEAARANPRLVIDRLMASGSAGNTTEFHSAIQALAETDPETADAYFHSARNPQMRQMIGFGIVGALAATDPAAAIAWARENDRSGNDNFEMVAVMALARLDPERALVEAQNGTNAGMRESLVGNVVMTVAADDPRKALMMTQSLEDPRLRDSGELHVAQAWLSQDPDAALAWLETLDDAKARAIIDNSGWSLLHSDVDAAMRLLPRVSEENQHHWRAQIAARLSQTRSPDDALAFIRQFEGEPNFPQLQAEVVGSIAVTDVARARQLADQLGDAASRDSAYLHIAMQQAAQSPPDALLTAQQIGNVHVRAQATASAITQAARQDPDAARRMVTQLPPGPARDITIVQVMSDWSNLESMEGLIETMEDPDLRSQAKLNRLYYAAQTDPDRARALLADPDIPAETREEVKAMLENGGTRID
jgi:hypothetical protein